jgi:hypothetical protein
LELPGIPAGMPGILGILAPQQWSDNGGLAAAAEHPDRPSEVLMNKFLLLYTPDCTCSRTLLFSKCTKMGRTINNYFVLTFEL